MVAWLCNTMVALKGLNLCWYNLEQNSNRLWAMKAHLWVEVLVSLLLLSFFVFSLLLLVHGLLCFCVFFHVSSFVERLPIMVGAANLTCLPEVRPARQW